MAGMSPAIAELLDEPDLVLKIAAAERALREESVRREAFRDAIQPHEKGEFINGKVIMSSPARHVHNHVSSLINRILGSYVQANSLGCVLYEKAMCGFSRNDYEPDLLWFGSEKAASLKPDTLVYPVPDFIVEILSPSTEKRDRGVKFTDYAAHGVREYWIVDANQRSVEQYLLPEGGESYELAATVRDGEIRPRSFPGLAIPVAAFFDDAANLDFLRSIL
jgi:Uma2 family endonuclease